MNRREFITLIGGAVAAWPLAARAQQSGRPIRLGFLGPPLINLGGIPQYQAFRTQLEELGFREGQNLTIDHRGLDDPRGPFVVAAELVRSRPDLIVAAGPETALQAVVGASGFVPVVMIAVNFDPLARGYIASLARPGGNITGFVFQQLELARKQVELLTQAFPDRTRLALLFDAQSADQFGAAETAAKALTLQVQALRLENPPYDFDIAFRDAVAGGAQMALVLSTPSFLPHMARVVELANRNQRSVETSAENQPHRRSAHPPAMFADEHGGRDFEGREGRRPAGRAGYEVRAYRQSQDRESDRDRAANGNPAARRRGD